MKAPWAMTLLIMGLAVAGCDRGAPVPVIGGVELAGSIRLDGLRHDYLLFSPHAGAEDQPLIVSLHGGGGDARVFDAFTGMRAHARRNGYAVLTPDGFQRTWNAGGCCDPAAREGVDHVAVIRAVVAEAMRTIDVDSRRVYVTGHSNGGMMAYRLACEAADLFAAAAPVAAFQMTENADDAPVTTAYECNPVRPVPILHIHGESDQCAPFEGGPSAGPAGGQRPAVADSIDFWVRHNDCQVPPRGSSFTSGDARCDVHTGCAQMAQVELCTVSSGGHVWPGTGQNPLGSVCGGTGVTVLDANSRIWDFFRGHTL
ncbi:MAG: PHB depolymerase family esterase [Oceanococcaceae bacterium]